MDFAWDMEKDQKQTKVVQNKGLSRLDLSEESAQRPQKYPTKEKTYVTVGQLFIDLFAK